MQKKHVNTKRLKNKKNPGIEGNNQRGETPPGGVSPCHNYRSFGLPATHSRRMGKQRPNTPVAKHCQLGGGLLLILLIYLASKLTLFTAFASYGIVMQTFLSAKIVYIASTMPPGANYLILFNSFISLLVILVLVMGYMQLLPLFLTVACLLTSIAARVIRPETVQMQFLLFFAFIELFSCALGFLAWRDVHAMEKENTDLRDEEDKILRTLHMTKVELTAYLAMSMSDEHDQKYIKSIFDSLDERSEHNILKTVKEHEMEKQLHAIEIGNVFPTLTPTEQEVCRLVIKGKTLREIAVLLDKTINNVSSVRIHIRKKLGLASGQDLRTFLLENIKLKK